MYWKCNGACAYALRVPGSHCGRYVLLVALWWLCRFPGSVERYVLLVARPLPVSLTLLLLFGVVWRLLFVVYVSLM